MSMVWMVAIEMAENMMDYHLTEGQVNLDDPQFWVAAVMSIGADSLRRCRTTISAFASMG
ncbi:hypothetical protein N7532_002732 [Penicillium argentinense]|uniref:Uncharacterized protein n=1 Tax=Penicillium argentinense TaxID=1131581 RepID=A0A9W9KLS9_9EURO|nr:uncharacterized protein N7532_002732 [Penicillium argentinense]KAJ5110087.1 hypothetical protein N7532_002732 [Penicillium argentinense]